MWSAGHCGPQCGGARRRAPLGTPGPHAYSLTFAKPGTYLYSIHEGNGFYGFSSHPQRRARRDPGCQPLRRVLEQKKVVPAVENFLKKPEKKISLQHKAFRTTCSIP